MTQLQRYHHTLDIAAGLPKGFDYCAQIGLPPVAGDFDTAEKVAKFVEGRIVHIDPTSPATDPRIKLGAPAPTNVRCPMPLLICSSSDNFTVTRQGDFANAFPLNPANFTLLIPNQGGLYQTTEFSGEGLASGDLLVSNSDGVAVLAADNTSAKSYIGRVERGVVRGTYGRDVLSYFPWPQFRH
jgi:hypothetical protein